ncbi:hypothetical protein SLS60_004607 [Paraconiothyrium brasiliense]|uniref:C2H2-type domain-containing protein n=1 Tax=Paraconiothyrium brasiliense TaxID=300254 RepID=A0ABR3RKU6_9PLEO
MSTHVFSDENKGKGKCCRALRGRLAATPQIYRRLRGHERAGGQGQGKRRAPYMKELANLTDVSTAAATATKSNQSTTGNSDDGDDESNSGAYSCPHCGKKYTREPNLKRHVRVNHGTGDKPFACPSCSHTDARKDNLKKHMKKAHGADWGLALYDAAAGISSDESSEGNGEASGTGGRKDEEDGENSQK